MKSMLYEHLTSLNIKAAADKGLVAILPIGSIEIHGSHMLAGTDSITVHRIAALAAESGIHCSLSTLLRYVSGNKHFLGTISLTAKTMLSLLEEMCDEITRNGFKKILILNGHGGNIPVLRLFLREMLNKRKDYVLYG